MALIGQAVSEEKIFENGGRTTDADGRRLDGYTISSPCEPNGSGELITDSYQNTKSQRKICIYTKAIVLFRITKGNYSNSIDPWLFIKSIHLEDRNVFARFDEIPSMTLYDIQETAYTKAIQNHKGR